MNQPMPQYQRQQMQQQQQQYRPQPAAKDDDKHRFSLIGFLLDILFSPLLFVIIGFVLFQDGREAVLFALLIITGLQLIKLVMRVFMLGLSALTFNIFGFVKNSIRIVSALVVIAIYWFIYVAVFGSNFAIG